MLMQTNLLIRLFTSCLPLHGELVETMKRALGNLYKALVCLNMLDKNGQSVMVCALPVNYILFISNLIFYHSSPQPLLRFASKTTLFSSWMSWVEYPEFGDVQIIAAGRTLCTFVVGA